MGDLRRNQQEGIPLTRRAATGGSRGLAARRARGKRSKGRHRPSRPGALTYPNPNPNQEDPPSQHFQWNLEIRFLFAIM